MMTDEGEKRRKELTRAVGFIIRGRLQAHLSTFLAIKGKTEGTHAVIFRRPVRYRLTFSTETCQCRERGPECHWANMKCNCKAPKERRS